MKSVCIVCGGQSHEHEISLISAESVLSNIDRTKYTVHTIIIDEKGNFFHSFDGKSLKDKAWKKLCDLAPCVIPQGDFGSILRFEDDSVKSVPIDVFFPVLHGENGEDGVIQGVFKMSHTAYVGGGVLSSASCMDKEVTHIRLDSADIKTAPYLVVRSSFDIDSLDADVKEKLDYPVFVKPANAGSSFGVSKAGCKKGLKKAVKDALKVDKKVLIEKFIEGLEVECAVLGNDDPISSSVIGQIAPTAEFYDFDAKYKDASTQLYIPAHVSDEVSKNVRETALKAYKTLDCQGLSRIDFFALNDGSIILNEINNLPGFTSISMYPKLFEASGISYAELIDRLIDSAEVK